MLRDQTTGNWRLSDESKHPVLASEGKKFVHIQFNGIGNDVAVVDHLGILHMYTLSHGVLSRMQHVPNGAVQSDGRSELDAVVGMHWLPIWPTEFRVSLDKPEICIHGLTRE